jgi:hypothetical protein
MPWLLLLDIFQHREHTSFQQRLHASLVGMLHLPAGCASLGPSFAFAGDGP